MSLRDELIQVAAVAVAIVTDMDKGSTGIARLDSPLAEWDSNTTRILTDIIDERERQEAKWGTRYDVPVSDWLVILGEEFGEACRAALEEVMYPKGGDDG